MGNPNDDHNAVLVIADFNAAISGLARAIPVCTGDPEIVDALAFAISIFGYMLAWDREELEEIHRMALLRPSNDNPPPS